MNTSRASMLAAMALSMTAGIPGLNASQAKLADIEARSSTPSPNQAEKQRPNTGMSQANALAKLLGLASKGPNRPSYPNGPGWTTRQVQRMALKKRNQRRNRLAHR